MKILQPCEFGYMRTLSFEKDGLKLMRVTLKYEGPCCSTSGITLDNEIIPFLAKAVNSHEELVLTLRAAIERVKMANNDGDPILSAWREDAEKLLAKVTSD